MPESVHTIHLASAFDQNYIMPFYVLLASLFHHNEDSRLIIHSIATGVSDSEKAGIEAFVSRNNASIFFYTVDEAYVRANVVLPENNHFTIATYYRLFLPAILPASVGKLLYIDTDAIVIGDLKKLYDTALGNAPFAAVPDSYPHTRTDLGLDKKEQYFNAGVLLIDVANWKQQHVTEQAIQFMNDYPDKIKYVDQDALNATQRGKWYTLAKKYNITWFDVPLETRKKDILKEAVIVHYTTSNKPWNTLGGNKLRYLYHGYLKKLPHARHKRYIDFVEQPYHKTVPLPPHPGVVF